MSDFITKFKRTHYCGDLKQSNDGQEVVLMGWTHRRRDHGGVIFVDLRDRTGLVQIVFNPEINPIPHGKAHSIRSEFVVAIQGLVRVRPEGMRNPEMKTGEIEVMVTALEIFNESKTPPFMLDQEAGISENIRLKYRYLDLRRPEIQRNLLLRSDVARQTRQYFVENGFVEVETPFLTKSTPEGARDYLVPSRVNSGTFYALPQSPQLFKQLLMVAGFDRYFQIVKCFRDEDLRADRQPEFTQIDIEMSFICEDDIIAIMEGFIAQLFAETLQVKLQTPFPRLPYHDAIYRYGKDNPDTRFSMELKDITDIVKNCSFKLFTEVVTTGGVVKCIKVKDNKKLSRKDLDELKDFVATFGAKGLAWARVIPDGWTSPIFKFLSSEEVRKINEAVEANEDDLILFSADTSKVVHDSLGNLRIHLAKKLGMIEDGTFGFTWVTEFPLLEYSDHDKRFVSTHHPFTSPVIEDLQYLETDPGKVRARAYDLVLNGSEIGGGSIRIHQKTVQEFVFKALGLKEEELRNKFGFLLDALEYGAPPHGGI
ncbi:MAG: aspartate--tRNA ligase, partial [Deltaproteobacteria bacterium]